MKDAGEQDLTSSQNFVNGVLTVGWMEHSRSLAMRRKKQLLEGESSRRELGRLSAAASGGKGGRWAQEMMTILAGMS